MPLHPHARGELALFDAVEKNSAHGTYRPKEGAPTAAPGAVRTTSQLGAGSIEVCRVLTRDEVEQ